MDEQGLRKYVRMVLESVTNANSEKEVLQKINRGDGGSIPVDQLSPEEVDVAETLVMRGLLRHVPAGHGVTTQGGTMGGKWSNMTVTGGRNVATPVDPKVAHRYPERYVVTSGGSHATDTFKHDTLHDERSRRRR